MAGSGTYAQSPIAHTPGHSSDREGLLGLDTAAHPWQREVREKLVGRRSRGPDQRVGGNLIAVGKADHAVAIRDDFRFAYDLDVARREFSLRMGPKLRTELGQNDLIG